MENKEFEFICGRLDEMTNYMKILNERMERLEEKTDDIHESVPFVRWLEGVGRAVSHRLEWLGVSRLQSRESDKDPSPLQITHSSVVETEPTLPEEPDTVPHHSSEDDRIRT